jgi:hypothetical protein
LVKFHAVSLNYRDLMFVRGVYNPKARLPAMPFSDCSGEVVAVGANVRKWNVGDRVCLIFTQGWIEGALSIEKRRTTLGVGDLNGFSVSMARLTKTAWLKFLAIFRLMRQPLFPAPRLRRGTRWSFQEN